MARVWIGIGGNVGDVHQSMVNALNALSQANAIEVILVSGLYKTPPWGEENQDWFLNACAELKSDLQPLELLEFVKALEKKSKRKKTYRWGPRTLDIDLLVYEGVELNGEKLVLPHPKMTERSFVMLPLNDIAPDLLVEGKTVQAHLKHLDISEIKKVGDGGAWH